MCHELGQELWLFSKLILTVSLSTIITHILAMKTLRTKVK